MINTHTSQAQWPTANGERPVRLLFFGKVGDALGRSADIHIPPVGCTVATLREMIAGQIEGAAEALGETGVRAAVNQQMTDDHAWVCPGDEVAFFSMFSGG